MPIFKAGAQLVFYAHVPKCGGSSVSQYLSQRFGPVAFNDKHHLRHDPKTQWTRSSPQHVDARSLARLFPPGFFDAVFTIVRHPVGRLISAYHFQMEYEGRILSRGGFSEWLSELPELIAEDPFIYDGHVRSMSDFVPKGAKVFHVEHGLDALVPWFDALTGTEAAPRAVPMANKRGRSLGAKAPPLVTPTPRELEQIAKLYAEDFRRFGYDIDCRKPLAPPPVLSADLLSQRDAERAEKARRARWSMRRLARKAGLKSPSWMRR